MSFSGSAGALKFVETWMGAATSDELVEEWRKSSPCKAIVAGARSWGRLMKVEEGEEGSEQESTGEIAEAEVRFGTGSFEDFGEGIF